MPFYRNIIFFCLMLLFAVSVSAQELTEKQRGIADRYAQLEQILLRMSEASATSNPRRAELLKKVLLASKDKLVMLRIESIADILNRRQLTEAIAGQEGIEKDLAELLKLLESENRDQLRQMEKEKIKEFLRDLEEIIHQEKALKARTAQEENEKLAKLEKPQKEVRLRAQSLQDRIAENENPERKPDSETEKNSMETQESDEKDGDRKSESGEKSEPLEKPDQSNEKQADLKPEKKDDSEPPSEKADDKPEPGDSPTQSAMEKAMKRMKQAEEKLQKAEKSEALEDQEEAIAELQRVKAELEKILRQIREEELLQTLEKLEARFKRMLRIEQSIRSQTEKLVMVQKKTEEPDERQTRIQSSRIAADQQSVLDDADAALILLREDGTAQAMVESLLQARFDMEDIKSRLDGVKLDSVTIAVEDAVIAALQEMLEAIDMAIKEAEKRKENPPQSDSPPGGEQETEPLIQALSELRMIRSMQQRVNDRTGRYEKEVEQLRAEANPDFESIKQKVEELARQQNRISRILHDLKVGKAK